MNQQSDLIKLKIGFAKPILLPLPSNKIESLLIKSLRLNKSQISVNLYHL